MQRLKVDEVDIKILSELQKDGRITNVLLAHSVGISAPPCLRRVRGLEEDGYIQGYNAKIDPQKLGFSIQVYVFIRLQSQHEEDLKNFENYVSAYPVVRECTMLSGDVDFILRCVSHDWHEFQNFLSKELTSAPNVRSVRTSLVIRSAKNEPLVPFECYKEAA